MSSHRPLLTRGRSVVFLVTGVLIAAFITSWARQIILTNIGAGLLEMLPWSLAKRLLLGVLLDLPQGIVTLAIGAIGGKFLVLSPWRAAPLLVAGVWFLDFIATWLIVHQLPLWTDPWVLAARSVLVAATMVLLAVALGWRPATKKAESTTSTV